MRGTSASSPLCRKSRAPWRGKELTMNRASGAFKELVAEIFGDGRLAEEGKAEERMARGGSKPLPRSKVKDVSQDGARKGGGVKTQRHAGPGRTSKTRPTGTKGRQLAKRARA
jgi:hypothetical protein